MSGYVVCEYCGDENYWEDELPDLGECTPCELVRLKKEITSLKKMVIEARLLFGVKPDGSVNFIIGVEDIPKWLGKSKNVNVEE